MNAKGYSFGETALMVAAQNGHVECARLLIEAGADVNAKDKYGKTALMQARGMKAAELAALLRKAGARE